MTTIASQVDRSKLRSTDDLSLKQYEKLGPFEIKDFLAYALSSEGQEKFAEWGYRPVEESALGAAESEFPEPSNLFTIRDLGGWDKVNDEFFDPDKGSVAKIEQDLGVSTAK